MSSLHITLNISIVILGLGLGLGFPPMRRPLWDLPLQYLACFKNSCVNNVALYLPVSALASNRTSKSRVVHINLTQQKCIFKYYQGPNNPIKNH